MSSTLSYLVIEYLPGAMDGHKVRPARIDGHYAEFVDAKEHAELWADNPIHKESRIVVAEIQHTEKFPERWLERDDDAPDGTAEEAAQ